MDVREGGSNVNGNGIGIIGTDEKSSGISVGGGWDGAYNNESDVEGRESEGNMVGLGRSNVDSSKSNNEPKS
jgi:hypothetical protein